MKELDKELELLASEMFRRQGDFSPCPSRQVEPGEPKIPSGSDTPKL